jgi:glucose-6-phosphate 1-dehydrogenase
MTDAQPRLRSGDLILFGATGDLAQRKLLPALYELDRTKRLEPENRILCSARGQHPRDSYLQEFVEPIRQHLPEHEFDADVWQRFLQRIDYAAVDLETGVGFERLAAMLVGRETYPRIFYCSTSPTIFGDIARGLAKHQLVTPCSRIVLEKPLGTSLETSHTINHAVGEVFAEEQIYRIDHYLGKETVQNLLVLRFANSLFEPLWNHQYVDHVQITIAEEVGVEGRWSYYNNAGALRDMVQNHLLQLLCLVAMEPPAHFSSDSVRDEKVKVLRALRPIGPDEAPDNTVRGQYGPGVTAHGHAPALGYLEESDGAAESNTETFVAIRAHIDNWRWSGVPFYLRTGKRLAGRVAEIVVAFKRVPHPLFNLGIGGSNRLILRLQPEDGIKLVLNSKRPGPGHIQLRPVALDLDFAEAFGANLNLEAYERLLADVLDANSTLFVRRDEIELAWTWIDRIRQAWQEKDMRPKKYVSYSWGPTASVALIERDRRTWHEDLEC